VKSLDREVLVLSRI